MPLLELEVARANRFFPFAGEYQHYTPPTPQHLGVHQLRDYPLAALVPYIDWTPFSSSGIWRATIRRFSMMKSSATRRRKCSAMGRRCSNASCRKKWLTANASYGLLPAQSDGDDIIVFADGAHTGRHALSHTASTGCERSRAAQLRAGRFHRTERQRSCRLPRTLRGDRRSRWRRSPRGLRRQATTTTRSCSRRSLTASREAFGEHLHERVRKGILGLRARRTPRQRALIREKYRGIRPAPGYPACPDHREKVDLFRVL